MHRTYFLFFLPVILILLFTINEVQSIEMDVKCAIYQHSDDENGDNVDVRIFAIGLEGSTTYTTKVIPDHSPSVTSAAKTDSQGIYWTVVKIPNGEYSLLFKVNIYEGNGTGGKVVATGDDDAPCATIYNSPRSKNAD